MNKSKFEKAIAISQKLWYNNLIIYCYCRPSYYLLGGMN